jgi:DNA polymerase V
MSKCQGLYVTKIYSFEESTKLEIPLFTLRVPAGFPYPGEDYIDEKLDLNKFLIKHPESTFFVKVEGDSMIDAGIHSGDILIVDRSLEATSGDIVIAALDGDMVVKQLRISNDGNYCLVPQNSCYKPVEITPDKDFKIWGVVTGSIRLFKHTRIR